MKKDTAKPFMMRFYKGELKDLKAISKIEGRSIAQIIRGSLQETGYLNK